MTTPAIETTAAVPELVHDTLSALLIANGTVLRDMRPLQRGMITAVQPLTIDGNEICTDTVLAELVTYHSSDELKRETETLPLKKTTYCDFEASMTAIPKYCFSNLETLHTVLVHAVPRITLDDILQWCETRFHEPYPHAPLRFYADWVRLVISRVKSVPVTGVPGFIRKAAVVPKLLFPAPEQIRQAQRKAFVNIVLGQVLMHHDKGIFHDRISAKTIFFPTAVQPKLLANYAGIPSATLADYLPGALLADDAPDRYGRQVRDVYCTAMLCYRIMTGEHFDGRTFSLDAPRPAGLVLRTITIRTRFSLSLRSFQAAGHSIVSSIQTIRALLQQVTVLFSSTAFAPWRNINRATGGLWRSIPVVGTLADIVTPTPAAQALRTVLDRHWFERYLRRKKRSGPATMASAGPDMHMLVAAFAGSTVLQIPPYSMAFHALTSEAQIRRQTFGTLMEGMARPLPVGNMPGRRFPLLTGVLLLFMITALVFLIRELQRSNYPDTIPPPVASLTTPADRPLSAAETTKLDTKKTAGHSVAGPVGPAKVQADHQTSDKDAAAKKTPAKPAAIPPDPARTSVNHSPRQHAKNAARATKSVIPQPPPPSTEDKVVPSPPPAPPGLLVAAEGTPDVYIVDGTGQPCNPAFLVFASTGRGKTAATAPKTLTDNKLYLIRHSGNAFGPIIIIRKCRSGNCDPTLYYTSSGINRISTPVTVRTGDLISPSSYALRRYLHDRQHMEDIQW